MKKTLTLLILALAWIITPYEIQAQKKGDPMLQVPLGFASYTFRNQWKNGVPEALDIIQKMGFTEFEGGAPHPLHFELKAQGLGNTLKLRLRHLRSRSDVPITTGMFETCAMVRR